MYGLVNKAIESLVVEKYGGDVWHHVKTNANATDIRFVATEVYDDQITYDLVAAAAEKLDVEPFQVLELFGEYWITFVQKAGFGNLLTANGSSMLEFLSNLDQFHSRLATSYPRFKPPEFEFHELECGTLKLAYFSRRSGLEPMMLGIIRGLAKWFEEPVDVEMKQEKDHFVFLVNLLDSVESPTKVTG